MVLLETDYILQVMLLNLYTFPAVSFSLRLLHPMGIEKHKSVNCLTPCDDFVLYCQHSEKIYPKLYAVTAIYQVSINTFGWQVVSLRQQRGITCTCSDTYQHALIELVFNIDKIPLLPFKISRK